ncbi:MAG: NAD(P)H-binding protein [Thermoleophilaceae bacterium]
MEAKAEADQTLQGSGLDFTIVRPGRLTDAKATGHVAAGSDVERGDVPRADVALALVAVPDTATTVGRTFNLVSGPDPVDRAIAAL